MAKVKAKIALHVPGSPKAGRYFSFRIKEELHNELSEYNRPERLLVVSDIEGNFQAFRRLLVKSHVIDKSFQWTFGDGHLVIAGDCFDRGEEVIECLWLIYSLEDKARKEGGGVHFILGNHEIMNLNGDWRYVHPKYAVRRDTAKTPSTALYDGNAELWRWICTRNIIEKAGDLLLVHGGISIELLNCGYTVAEINNRVRPYYAQANNLFADPLLATVFNSELSPFWYRGYYNGEASEDLIDATLARFGVNTIITGHTMMDTIRPFFNGKVINVDTDHAAENSEALLIHKDRFYKIDRQGKKERIR